MRSPKTVLFSSLLVVAVAAATATGCSSAPAEGAAESSDSDLTVGAALSSVQIRDLGAIAHATSVHEKYTGKPRYVGTRIQVSKGQRIDASSFIASEIRPTAVIANASLKVLAQAVGFTLTGGPNTSTVFLSTVAPADGTYWVLFGEGSRTPCEIDLTVGVVSSAGAACKAASDCVSNLCSHDQCAQSKVFTECLHDADCTTGACGDDGVCQSIELGHACKADGDCSSTLCDHGTCACYPSGHALDEAHASQCCSQNWQAGPTPHCG